MNSDLHFAYMIYVTRKKSDPCSDLENWRGSSRQTAPTVIKLAGFLEIIFPVGTTLTS